MYEELVKRLRESADWADHFAVLMGRAEDVSSPIKRESADAIEKLNYFNLMWQEAAKIAHEAELRWIPVTERLPEEKKAHYLCLLDDDSMEVVYWSKVPDWASKGEWTWHNPNWKNVTHWMSLPKLPKEEEE